jgi:hypothetical protein
MQNGNISLWKNGILGTPNMSGVLNSTEGVVDSTLGGLSATLYRMMGTISEVILFDSVLSTTDRQTIERN